MAVKIGFQTSAPQGGIDNPHLSNGVYTITSKWWPYSQSIAGSHLSGAVNRNEQIRPSRQSQGFMPTSYSDDFYHRIHTRPTAIDLGNVVSAQEFKVYVWNAYFTSRHLSAITGINEGIMLEGQTAPYNFNPLEEQEYTITVTPDGSTTIDNDIIWQFDNEADANITIKGTRIVAFAFMPNWKDGITERLEWSTDILQSETGVEQRSALYVAPRRFFSIDLLIYEEERQLFNNCMSWSARNWAIPLWFYIQFTTKPLAVGDTFIECETDNIEFVVGGLVFLWRDVWSYELAEIAAIKSDGLEIKRPLLNDWAAGTRVYPAVSAIFAQTPSLKRITDTLQETNINFRVAQLAKYDAIAPTTSYKGYPVFDLVPEESEDLTSEYQRLLIILDNGMALPRVTDSSGYSFMLQSYKWQKLGRDERAKYRSLLYYMNGKQKAIWIPSHAQDLTVADIISPTEPIMIVKQCGYSRFAKNDSDKKIIHIRLTDGSIYYRQILGATDEGKTERLLLDAPLNKQLTPEKIDRISFMRLCRLNDDSVEIKHITDSEGVANSKLTFMRVIDNEL